MPRPSRSKRKAARAREQVTGAAPAQAQPASGLTPRLPKRAAAGLGPRMAKQATGPRPGKQPERVPVVVKVGIAALAILLMVFAATLLR